MKEKSEIRIEEEHDVDGSITINGYVKEEYQAIMSISNSRGYWKVQSSNCLPTEIDKAKKYIRCMNKVIERFNEYTMKIEVITDPNEIAKLKPKLEELKKECLRPRFELSPKEMKNFEEFNESHGPGKCNAERYSTGECFTFHFMPSGVGMCKWVTCSCGEERNITDFGNDI